MVAPGTRWAAGVLTLFGASALLTGCAGNAPVPNVPATSSAPTESSPPTTTESAPATVTVTASPTAPASGGACRTNQLAVTRVDRGGSGMMKSDNSLQFTNISASTCTLHGFPTVTAVGANGVTLTPPAEQDGSAGASVTLASHGTAVAQMLITHPEAYDPSQCKSVTAKGLRIYPPGQNTALFLAQDFTVCAQGGPNTLRVQPLSNK